MKNKDNRKQVAKTMTRDDLIKHAVNCAAAKMLDVGITSHQVSHQRKSFCMPGTMIAGGYQLVILWVNAPGDLTIFLSVCSH